MPVDLLDFTASRRGKDVELTWRVGREDGVAGYTIEWTRAPGAAFTPIGQRYARGHHYYEAFVRPPSVAGPAYYRLRIDDLDGSVAYSPIVRLQSTTAALYPNPVAAGARVTVPAAGPFRVYDLAGRLVFERVVATGQGVLLALPGGTYLYDTPQARGLLVVVGQ